MSAKSLLGQAIRRLPCRDHRPSDRPWSISSAGSEHVMAAGRLKALAMNPLPKVIWMQLGAAQRRGPRQKGRKPPALKVVMNRCPKIEYGRLSSENFMDGRSIRETLSSKRAPMPTQGPCGFRLNRSSLGRRAKTNASDRAGEKKQERPSVTLLRNDFLSRARGVCEVGLLANGEWALSRALDRRTFAASSWRATRHELIRNRKPNE